MTTFVSPVTYCSAPAAAPADLSNPAVFCSEPAATPISVQAQQDRASDRCLEDGQRDLEGGRCSCSVSDAAKPIALTAPVMLDAHQAPISKKQDIDSREDPVFHSLEDAARFKRRLTMAFHPSEVVQSTAMDPSHVDSATLDGLNASQEDLAMEASSVGRINEDEAIHVELAESTILASFESSSNWPSTQVCNHSLNFSGEARYGDCSSSSLTRVDVQQIAVDGLGSGRKMQQNQTSCVLPRRGCAVCPWKGPLLKKKIFPKIKLDAFLPAGLR